jgi:hypothetical protein
MPCINFVEKYQIYEKIADYPIMDMAGSDAFLG